MIQQDRGQLPSRNVKHGERNDAGRLCANPVAKPVVRSAYFGVNGLRERWRLRHVSTTCARQPASTSK